MRMLRPTAAIGPRDGEHGSGKRVEREGDVMQVKSVRKNAAEQDINKEHTRTKFHLQQEVVVGRSLETAGPQV